MLYDTIKKEVGKRLGDPLLDNYRALVGNTFAESVGNLIREKDYDINDINTEVDYPLLKTKTYQVSVTPMGYVKFPLESDVFVIQDVLFLEHFTNEEPLIGVFRPSIREISNDYERRMVLEDALKPAAYEVFYLINNYNIIFYPSHDFRAEIIPTVVMNYLKSPSNREWMERNADDLDIESDVGLSPQFIQRAIKRTVSVLAGNTEEKE
jgi:hypothetical protein